MRFVETPLPGLVVIETDPFRDDRGSFGRLFCEREFGDRGLPTSFAQHSLSVTPRRGTVRGLHFQRPPHAETKLVRSIHGTILDVVVDLRADSPTYRRSFAIELDDRSTRGLLIPPGFAHGFQALTEDVRLLYLITPEYAPAFADGVRFDDPAFEIRWPLEPIGLSERDRSWSDWDERSPLPFANGACS